MKNVLEMLKDGIIEMDDRIMDIMFRNDSLGSETERAILAVVLMPVLPLALAYGIVRGTVVLTNKVVEKVVDTVEEKRYYAELEERNRRLEAEYTTPVNPINVPTTNEISNKPKTLTYTNPDEKRN